VVEYPARVEVTELTGDEMARLQAELDQLRGPRRAEIVEAIAVARGHGDLSENFEYHAAKNEQGLLERQITILEHKLANAVVIDRATMANGGLAGTGSRVEILDEQGETTTVTISNAGGVGAVSPHSPLGKALIGAGVGDKVTVQAPSATWSARVVSIA
jgi:transcription elongation factor GreA